MDGACRVAACGTWGCSLWHVALQRGLQSEGVGSHDVVALPAAHERAPQRHWLESVAEGTAALQPLCERRAAKAEEDGVVLDRVAAVEQQCLREAGYGAAAHAQ